MTTGGFGTTTEEMDRAGRHVHAVNQQVQSELAALRTRLVPLGGLWRGPAALEFAQLMARWDADAAVLNEALRSIGDAVLGTSTDYARHEDDRAVGLGGIRAALG